jgi:hypothetical protein
VWAEFLPDARVSVGAWSRLRIDVTGLGGDSRRVRLPDLVDGRQVWLVVTVDDVPMVDQLVSAVTAAVGLAAEGLTRHDRRDRPLVALPLAGTGQGGLAGRRGDVVAALVPALQAVAAQQGVDVALVLFDPRDLAAVQANRSATSWDELSTEQLRHADELGLLAARGELSLFLGAGISVPVGLPSWSGLLREMAAATGLAGPGDDEVDLPRAAEPLVEALGDGFGEFMRARFATRRHAVAHALLSGLQTRQMVTTNFDLCMEEALDPVLGPDGYRVMTRNLALNARPWLLKLHGDVVRPDTLVLTASHYDRLSVEFRALHGVVQALLLTSHLLFVGFSLSDRDFVELAEGVQRVRRQADGEPHAVGTVIALHAGAVNSERWAADLNVLAMTEGRDDGAAARLLEVFLDRVSWRAAVNSPLAARYLLDPSYEDGFSAPADVELRASLRSFVARLPGIARESAGWPVVQEALRQLGQADHSR